MSVCWWWGPRHSMLWKVRERQLSAFDLLHLSCGSQGLNTGSVSKLCLLQVKLSHQPNRLVLLTLKCRHLFSSQPLTRGLDHWAQFVILDRGSLGPPCLFLPRSTTTVSYNKWPILVSLETAHCLLSLCLLSSVLIPSSYRTFPSI